MATPADSLARLLEILDRAEIPYSIGGSVASSTHGIPRTTMDVDLVADIKPDQIDELVEALSDVAGGKGGYWEDDQGYEWYAGI